MFLNVDLLGQIPIFLDHIQSWKDLQHLSTNPSFLEKSIIRYEKYWLPLLAGSEVELVPPTDIHWVWYLHMLSPVQYTLYCKKRFDFVLNHKFKMSAGDRKRIKNITKHIWSNFYPDEPFELDSSSPSRDFHKYSFELRIIFTTALSEISFLHRCSLPHFREQSFHVSAVQRYKKFLFLKQQCPNWTPCRPPTDLELVWRVHLNNPSQYISDVIRIIDESNNVTDFGTYSLHQDMFEMHKNLCPSLTLDNQFWAYFFPDDESAFHMNGCMNTTTAVFNEKDDVIREFISSDFDTDLIKECVIRFEELLITELWCKQKHIKVFANLLGANSFQQKYIFQLKEEAEYTFKSLQKRHLKLEKKKFFGECKFVKDENKGIEISVYVGGGVLRRYKLVAQKVFDPLHHYSHCIEPLPTISSHSTTKVKQQITLPKVIYTDPSITLTYTLELPQRNPFTFTLDRNKGEFKRLPNHLKGHLWNVLAWQSVLNGDDDEEFLVARHSLKCREHRLAFGVEVVRSQRSNLSAVSVFHNNSRLVVVSFSIDNGFLPDPSQVLETCQVTLDPDKAEKAMLIRKHDHYDSVIVARSVEDLKKDKKYMNFTTYNTSNQRSSTSQVDFDDIHTITNNITTIDVPSGKIEIRDRVRNVPQQIAWAFSVGCLFLSSQWWSDGEIYGKGDGLSSIFSGSMRSLSTRFSDVTIDDGTISDRIKNKERMSFSKMRRNKKRLKKRRMSASFSFLLACGLRFDNFGSTSNLSSISKNGFTYI